MSDLLEMAKRGRNKARFSGAAHHFAAEAASRKHVWLGVPVVVFTSVVATAIFASISDAPPSKEWQIATGLVSITAAVLSALQTFFRFAEQGQSHLTAAANYMVIRRKLDLFLVRHKHVGGEGSAEQALQELEPLLEELEGIATTAPVVSQAVYQRGKNAVIESEKAAVARSSRKPAKE